MLLPWPPCLSQVGWLIVFSPAELSELPLAATDCRQPTRVQPLEGRTVPSTLCLGTYLGR